MILKIYLRTEQRSIEFGRGVRVWEVSQAIALHYALPCMYTAHLRTHCELG